MKRITVLIALLMVSALMVSGVDLSMESGALSGADVEGIDAVTVDDAVAGTLVTVAKVTSIAATAATAVTAVVGGIIAVYVSHEGVPLAVADGIYQRVGMVGGTIVMSGIVISMSASLVAYLLAR